VNSLAADYTPAAGNFQAASFKLGFDQGDEVIA